MRKEKAALRRRIDYKRELIVNIHQFSVSLEDASNAKLA
jgi:hypothetical protein